MMLVFIHYCAAEQEFFKDTPLLVHLGPLKKVFKKYYSFTMSQRGWRKITRCGDGHLSDLITLDLI